MNFKKYFETVKKIAAASFALALALPSPAYSARQLATAKSETRAPLSAELISAGVDERTALWGSDYAKYNRPVTLGAIDTTGLDDYDSDGTNPTQDYQRYLAVRQTIAGIAEVVNHFAALPEDSSNYRTVRQSVAGALIISYHEFRFLVGEKTKLKKLRTAMRAFIVNSSPTTAKEAGAVFSSVLTEAAEILNQKRSETRNMQAFRELLERENLQTEVNLRGSQNVWVKATGDNVITQSIVDAILALDLGLEVAPGQKPGESSIRFYDSGDTVYRILAAQLPDENDDALAGQRPQIPANLEVRSETRSLATAQPFKSVGLPPTSYVIKLLGQYAKSEARAVPNVEYAYRITINDYQVATRLLDAVRDVTRKKTVLSKDELNRIVDPLVNDFDPEGKVVVDKLNFGGLLKVLLTKVNQFVLDPAPLSKNSILSTLDRFNQTLTNYELRLFDFSGKAATLYGGVSSSIIHRSEARRSFRDLAGLKGPEKWQAMERERRALLRQVYGQNGLSPVVVIPFDHDNAATHYFHPELNVTEIMLMLARVYSKFADGILIHPGFLTGRYRTDTGQFVSLRDIASDPRYRNNKPAVQADFGPIQPHPDLPQNISLWLKWEGNKTPNGDTTKGPRNAIGNRPTNQGEELEVSPEEFASAEQVVGFKYNTYIDSSLLNSFNTIMPEIRNQSIAVHQAGFLFAVENLPAKTRNGVPADQAFETPADRFEWESSMNTILSAEALNSFEVDFDVFKFVYPGESFLKRLNELTTGHLLQMLSGGDVDNLVPNARQSAEKLDGFRGAFPGRAIWQPSFKNVPSNPIPEAKTTTMAAIEHDLETNAKARYEALKNVPLKKQVWESLGLTREEFEVEPEFRIDEKRSETRYQQAAAADIYRSLTLPVVPESTARSVRSSKSSSLGPAILAIDGPEDLELLGLIGTLFQAKVNGVVSSRSEVRTQAAAYAERFGLTIVAGSTATEVKKEIQRAMLELTGRPLPDSQVWGYASENAEAKLWAELIRTLKSQVARIYSWDLRRWEGQLGIGSVMDGLRKIAKLFSSAA
ncbi:MAG: hypothetical protein HYZ83_06335 [Candidatus Omnitrophica bacterium]|nr:hypothetical protein [Candidatus Omnitrophota bacterium]